MRNWLTFGGKDSRDFGVYISGQGTFSAPEKAYSFYAVPGRNGALIGNERRLENIQVSYECFIYADFSKNIADFRTYLLSLDGYQKLTDSYHPDEFRMACFVGPLEPEVTRRNNAGSFTLTFNCKPQRFLTSGNTKYSPISGSVTGNPIYANAEDVDLTSLQINISLDTTRPSQWEYNPVRFPEFTVNGTTYFATLPYNVMEGVFNANGTGSITKIAEYLPRTGWAQVSGYTTRYSVPFSPSGTITECTNFEYKTSEPPLVVGRCWMDSGNFIVGAPANVTTLEAFYEFLDTMPGLAVLETKSASWLWNPPSTLPPGWVEMSTNASTITVDITASNTLVNPTLFPSKPLIRVVGNGTITVNGITITVVNSTQYVDIDCDLMDCYEGTTNRNADVTFSTYDFPTLAPGDNTFTIVSGVTGIVVTPRWWRV